MSGRLQGKVAIVTGAGQGIGEAIARAFAHAGAAVCVSDVNITTASTVAEDLQRQGHASVFAITCDVTRPEQVTAMVDQTRSRFGAANVLVNNAGINVFHDPLQTEPSEWQRCFSVDLDAAWTCSRAVLPGMLAQKCGSIINIASTHSFFIIPGCFPYPVAKHALMGLTRALGIEYARQGVRVNAIAPGYIETSISDVYWKKFPDPQKERDRIYNLHPPGRIGRPEEVAMTAVFLATDEAPFINASCIMIDGGRSVLYHE